jgi:hypothetical protein
MLATLVLLKEQKQEQKQEQRNRMLVSDRRRFAKRRCRSELAWAWRREVRIQAKSEVKLLEVTQLLEAIAEPRAEKAAPEEGAARLMAAKWLEARQPKLMARAPGFGHREFARQCW